MSKPYLFCELTHDFTNADVDALSNLRRHLSRSPYPAPCTRAKLARALSVGTIIHLAREAATQRIIATASLSPCYPALSDPYGMIDDVVTHRDHRKRGIGNALHERQLDKARALGLRKLELTTGDDRPDAHRLYERNGWQRRDTNVYVKAL